MFNNKKSFIVFLITLCILLNTNIVNAKEPIICSEAAIVIDYDTGAILYAKNEHQKRPIASTTKIMTAILAIEKGNLKDIVEISQRASLTGEASINLVAGERITLENLLYGAMLKSGNDACIAIAEHISQTVEDFVKLMNLKALLLGCYNTNFVNTNGLPAKNHYSTAYDLAVISRYALENPIFKKIVSTPYKTIVWENSSRKRKLKNTNKLLFSFPGINGVKTGTTREAGQCLVASINKNNRNLVAVVLKSKNRFRDAQVLLKYGLENFRNIQVVKSDIISRVIQADKEFYVKPDKDLIITVKKNEKVNITYKILINPNSENRFGYIVYFNNGKEVGKVPLLAVKNEMIKQ